MFLQKLACNLTFQLNHLLFNSKFNNPRKDLCIFSSSINTSYKHIFSSRKSSFCLSSLVISSSALSNPLNDRCTSSQLGQLCFSFMFLDELASVWLVYPRRERWRLLPCGISVTDQLYPLTMDLQRFRKEHICISIVQEFVWRQRNSHFVCHTEQREGRFLS